MGYCSGILRLEFLAFLSAITSEPIGGFNGCSHFEMHSSIAFSESSDLVNRMCLSNSDFEVQFAGYISAQSPTNWEPIRGKDPSIFCRPPWRLSIALDDENPNCEIQDCVFKRYREFAVNTNFFGMQNGLKYEMARLISVCVCVFDVRQVMSLQNVISNTHIL